MVDAGTRRTSAVELSDVCETCRNMADSSSVHGDACTGDLSKSNGQVVAEANSLSGGDRAESTDASVDCGSKLRPIVIDGSNVAMR
jgi:hypothetical protein